MKAIIAVVLVVGMLVFQSSIFSGEMKILAAVLGVVCFLGLIAWSVYNKRKAADPALMLNDVDSD